MPQWRQPVAAGQGAPAADRLYRVLLAEDNATVVKVTQKVLEHAGYQCTSVKNGEEALAELVRRDFDAALFDMNMPVMNGLEAIKAYHFMQPSDMRVPIIMFSADRSVEAREACLAAGAAEFMPKPIRLDTLPPTLDRLVKTSDNNHQGGAIHWAALNAPVPAQQPGADAVINYSTLAELDRIGQDCEFVNGLLLGFVKDNRARIAKLDELLRNMRYEEFREMVHAIKGAAMSIGATSLKHTCQQVEKLTPAELGRETENVVTAMRTAFEQLCEVLDHYRERRDRSASNDYR
jgi:two-component system sensor histidine kinase RpfC